MPARASERREGHWQSYPRVPPTWDAMLRKIGDVFPHDDPVARFVVTMWAIRNDLEYVLELIRKTNPSSLPVQPEFMYLVRLATAHLFEGAQALRHYRTEYPNVDKFLAGLPGDGVKALRKAENAPSQIGGKALEHTRVHTFHYPSPDPTYSPSSDAQLEEVLREDRDNTFTPPLSGIGHFGDRAMLPTADMLMLRLALRKYDPDKLNKQFVKTMHATTALRNVALRVWEKYLADRGLLPG